jgi:hypothetical protein
VSGDVPDEQTVRVLVQSCGATEETRQEGIEGSEWHQATSVFHEKLGGKIGVVSQDAGVIFVDGELSENVVVVETPVQTVGLGADCAEGFKDFEQADVVAALALHNGEGIVGDGGVDGEPFLRNCGGEQDREEQ